MKLNKRTQQCGRCPSYAGSPKEVKEKFGLQNMGNRFIPQRFCRECRRAAALESKYKMRESHKTIPVAACGTGVSSFPDAGEIIFINGGNDVEWYTPFPLATGNLDALSRERLKEVYAAHYPHDTAASRGTKFMRDKLKKKQARLTV